MFKKYISTFRPLISKIRVYSREIFRVLIEKQYIY